MFVPAYPPFFETLRDGRREIVRLALLDDETGWHIDFDEVARAFADGVRALVLNNPHNPTGKVLTGAELERLLDLARRHDVFVVSDEVHAPLTLPGSTHVPWPTLGSAAADRGVVITGATKAFNIAGLKCSVLVAAGEARAVVDRIPTEFKIMAGHLGAIASIAAFRDGDPWLDALLAHLSRNRAVLERRIAAMHPRARWHPPQATYLAWLDLRGAGLGSDPARHILERARLALNPGPDFDATEGLGRARLNFGTTRDVLDEILSRLEAAL
jgi:cystathionine beta-lyase